MERADAHFVECSPGGSGPFYAVYTPAVAAQDATAGTYKYTYISESGGVWGVPIVDTDLVTLDAGPAVDRGGGIVGIPCTNNPFVEGDLIKFTGTDNYDASNYTLTAGTTTSELQFSSAFSAETFDGTETLLKLITSLENGAGRMAKDSSDNIYYGHNWDGTSYVTRIASDGTKSNTFLNTSWPPGLGGTITCVGVALSDDEAYLYIMLYETNVTNYGYVEKYDLSTGNAVWTTPTYPDAGYVNFPGYDLDVDENGNAYMARATLVKFAAADGSTTSFTGGGVYEVVCDDDWGVVISGGGSFVAGQPNLWVHTYDGSTTDTLEVGSGANAIQSGCVIVLNGYIYVLSSEATPRLYKVSWDGSSLAVVDSVATPVYAVGLYADPWDNIVVINQDFVTGQDDVMYFYDTDLILITHTDGQFDQLLRTWDAAAGGSWFQGEAIKFGTPGTPATNGSAAYWTIYDSSGSEVDLTPLIGETVCILADGVVYPSQVVDDNGRIDMTAFSTATKIHIGLNYASKLKPMKPVSQPDMMKKRVTCKEMGISVHNTDDSDGRSEYMDGSGVLYGVHDDDMKQIDFNDSQWKNKSGKDGLFTGSVAVSVPDGFSVNLPLQIMTDSPLPCTVRAMIPKVDVTGV